VLWSPHIAEHIVMITCLVHLQVHTEKFR